MTAELKGDAPEQIKPTLSVALELQEKSDKFFVVGRFGLEGTNPQSGESVVSFRYHAVAGYGLSEGILPGRELLMRFAETSSMVHLWPYFRAHVQSSASLMLLPPLIVPPFIPGSLRRPPEFDSGRE